VEYLGHVIFAEGVSTDPAKIVAVQNWPMPATLKQLRGFLDLACYYRRFVRNCGTMARALTEMLKKDKFQWTPAAKIVFQQLKESLTSALVLAMPDFTQIFVIEVYASGQGIGAMLMQQHHPMPLLAGC